MYTALNDTVFWLKMLYSCFIHGTYYKELGRAKPIIDVSET